MLRLLTALAALLLIGASQPPTPKEATETNQNKTAPKETEGSWPPSPVGHGTPKTADDRIADYTYWVMILTGVLGAVGAVQGCLIWRQIRLGRDEFNATHRPRFLLRDLELVPDGTAMGWNIEFSISNAGDGDGTIAEASMRIRSSGPEPLEGSLLQFDLWPVIGVKLGPSEGETIIRPANVDWAAYSNAVTTEHWARVNGTAGTKFILIFEGHIIYVGNDTAKTRRKTSFQRAFDFGTKRFRPGDDPEREYAD